MSSTSAIWRRASTMRWLVSLAWLAATGCAFSDGQPWGEAELSLQVRFDPPSSRLTSDGRLITAKSFEVELDSMAVRFDAMAVRMAGAGSAEFDPANPPEGYSLCHNGHCHSASGELVGYEDIILEQSGGGFSITQAASDDAVVLTSQSATVALGECSNDCRLEQGDLSAVEVGIALLDIRGRIFDATDAERVPEAGLDFTMAVAPASPLAEPIHAVVANGRQVGVRVAVDLYVTEKLFDDLLWVVPDGAGDPVDFSTTAGSDVTEKLSGESELNAAVSRFN